jgi:hypothetical protein
MLKALGAASLDDEPSNAAEDASAADALDVYRQGRGVTSDELRSELDLD